MSSKTSDQSVRIQASLIRKRLLARNGSAYFKSTLAEIADADLVRMDAENHPRKLQWVSEQGRAHKSHGRI